MAFGIIFDEPVKFALRLLLANQGNVLHVDLFTNDHEIDRADVLADYILAAYPGYVQLNWDAETVTLDSQHRGVAVPKLAIFSAPTSGAVVNVYGFLVQYFNVASGTYKPLFADRFTDPPITLAVADPDLTFGLAFRDFDAHKDD